MMFWMSSGGVVVKRRDCVMPAQFTTTSILLCSSPLANPCELRFVVLQNSGDVIEPEMCRCFDAADAVTGVKVFRAVSRFSFEREIRVQRYDFLAKACAIARPIPRLPPVMST